MVYSTHMEAAHRASGNIVLEAVMDIVRFPLWWYSHGLLRALRFAKEMIVGYERSLAVHIWVKNIFVPMFGQYDWQSRIISVFMRVVNIVGRGIALMLVGLVITAGTVAYVALPIVAGLLFIYSLLSALVI